MVHVQQKGVVRIKSFTPPTRTYARRLRTLWSVAWHDVVAGTDGRNAGTDRLDDGAGLVAKDGGEESCGD